MEHLGHIVILLEFLQELVDRGALLLGHGLEVVGDTHELGRLDFKAVLFEILLYVGILLESAGENYCAFIVGFPLL